MSRLGFELLDNAEFHRQLCADPMGVIGRLIEAIQPVSIRFCSSLGLQAADIQDVLQNSYIKLFNALSNAPSSSEAFGSWWFTIVRNTAYDLFRKRRPDTRGDCVETAAGDSISDPGETVAAVEIVNHALSALEPEERKALDVYYVDKLGTQADCAAALGVSLTTFKYWLRNAESRFQNALLPKDGSSANTRHFR